MIRPFVGMVVTDEAVIAHAGRVRRPVVDVVSAFGENDAVKTKRRAEEKRNPERGVLRRECGEPFCAARGRFDEFIFHEAPKLYPDRRMIVYANQLIARTTEAISCRSSSSDITFRKPPLASPYDTAHPLAHNVGITWFSPVSYLKWTGVVFWLLNPGTVASCAALAVLPVLYLSLPLALIQRAGIRSTSSDASPGGPWGPLAVACTQIIRNGLTLQSPYKQTVAYLRGRRSSDQVVDANWPVWQFYLKVRMASRPEDGLATADTLKNMMQTARQTNTPPVVPLVLVNRDLFGEESRFRTFFNRLFTLLPGAEWPMRYARLPVFQKETFGWMYTDVRRYHPGFVTLFWIDKDTLDRLLPGRPS